MNAQSQVTLAPLDMPTGIRSRTIDGVNGLAMHVLEAGFERAAAEKSGRPAILLLHGFPELAYSWRKIMPALAEAGYYVIAPDLRGYGRTTGWDGRYEGDVASFRMTHLVKDTIALVKALGLASVHTVVGHDFGSPLASWCALIHPEIFQSLVMMSAPFGGPPGPATASSIHDEMLSLPRPRKHYQWYYSTPAANADMLNAKQGLQAFLRAYYHAKSADWAGNVPAPLASWSATELAKLPTYYVMDQAQTMAQTVEPYMPSAQHIARCAWLPEQELAVYAAEYARVGFQGGLQWYRCGTDSNLVDELRAFGGRTINVPSCYVAGASDWGIYQKPGEFERMQSTGCTDMRGCHLVPGAGHWVQQEQPGETVRLLLSFFATLPA
jgi:pimeloyl-ACP methyl ester carboxylesterase